MRWATIRLDDGTERAGLVDGDEIYALGAGVAVVDLLGDDGSRLAEAAAAARRSPSSVHPLAEVHFRPPIPKPPSIRDFSAFEGHIRGGLEAQGFDMPDSWYEAPVFWFCNANSVMGDGDTVTFPGHCHEMDYELEIGMVIGRPGIDLTPAEAESHIAGFCIYNDWSARDLQREEMHRAPIGPAKGKDFASSSGPVLVTADEIADRRKGNGFDLEMTATVNGNLSSRGNWSAIYWSCGEMVSFASRHTALVPGDILATGTCTTGCLLERNRTPGAERAPWLEDGDEVALTVEGLGTLRNTLRRGGIPAPLRP